MSIMNNQFATTRRNLGFSMIDVLVAIIVLATGLLALAALQAALTRNSADARARAQIGAYADGLIDQLRASGYDNIAAGTISASSGTTAQKSAATTMQNATGVSSLSTAITVARYYGSGSTFTTTAPSSVDGTTPEYKEVNVTSSWTDAQGQSRSLKLSTIVSPTSVSHGNTLTSGTPLSASATMTPVVRQFRPDYTAGVIPIAVNPSDSTAATNPKPEILGTKTQTLAGVSYNVLTYTNPATAADGTANQVQVQQQVDTRIIGCHCKYGAGVTDTTSVFAQPYRPTYWNGTQYSTPVKTTWAYTNLGADPAYSSTQDEFCDVCCRDRNDTQGDTTVNTTTGQDGVLFNPWNTDYDHWGYSGNTLTKVAAAPSSNGSTAFGTSTGSYVNACRMIRVNGQYSAATDLQSYFFGFIATDTASNAKVPTDSTSTNVASSPTPTSTATTNYSNFVLAYLKKNLGGAITASGFPYDSPSNGYPTSTNATNALNKAAQLWSDNGLNSPANINITYSATTDYRYLHARGFYIDHLEPAAVTAINKAITNCSGTISDCVLQMIPFTTINLTELAAWTTDANGSKVVTVSDNAITGVGTNGAPLRGAVNALATAANNASGNAVANMGLSNSAVTGVLSNAPINTEDVSTVPASQQFTLTTGGSSSGGVVYFQFAMSGLPQIATYGSTSSPTVTWAGTSSLGTLSTGTSTPCQTGSAGSYSIIYASSCSNKGVVTANLSATPIASAPVGLNVSVKSYNAQILGSATTGGNVVGCTSEVQTQCKVYKVSGITLGSNTLSASSLAISTTDPNGMNVSGVVTVPASMTSPAFTGFSSTSSTAPDQLVITFTQDTVNSYSVAGTCGACNNNGKNCTYTAGTCTQ